MYGGLYFTSDKNWAVLFPLKNISIHNCLKCASKHERYIMCDKQVIKKR